MKITNLSLAAIAVVAMTTGAMADADKGIDFKISGQAVVYYETQDAGDMDLFGQGSANGATTSGTAGNSVANAGLQLNANSDLGNGFGLGLQGSALSTWGLENQLVSSTKQGGYASQGDTANGTSYFNITKAYLTKQIGNTTLKAGRQELPKSLSPLAFSEGWNVFKNTFDAIVAINTDIPDTTVVGAYVSRANGSKGDTTTFGKLAGGAMDEGAYMLTVANKSSKIVQPTISYYALKDITIGAPITTTDSGSAIWADVQVDAGLPVKLALQGGQIDPKNGLDKTNVWGAKASAKLNGVALSLAYSDVNDGAVSVQNVGTGVKTPLYTQMVYNQGNISSDASTTVLKAAMPAGPGKLIAQYGMTTDNSAAKNDYNELDIMYKTKALGMNVFAAYIMRDADKKSFGSTAGVSTVPTLTNVPSDDKNNIVRVWTRYNF